MQYAAIEVQPHEHQHAVVQRFMERAAGHKLKFGQLDTLGTFPYAGREFLRFVGAMYGMDRSAIERKIGSLSELFETDGFLDELAQTYSHGMKQRVVVSAAMLHEPRVLVIDEPMVGLDPKGARTLKAVLGDLTGDGVIVFMSTHTLAVAEEIADRVGIIREGSIIALGDLEEIYATARTDRRLEDAFLRLTEET